MRSGESVRFCASDDHLPLETWQRSEPEIVCGIPNKVGVYEVDPLADAIEVLWDKGITNSPEYWEKTAPKVKYLPELLVKIAEKLK